MGKYKNTLDILKQTVKNEGVLALYKGMVSGLLPLQLCGGRGGRRAQRLSERN